MMLLPAVTGSGTPTLVTLRSACPPTPTAMATGDELFPGTVSFVAVVTLGVSVISVPEGVPAVTLTITWKFVVVAGASDAIVHVIVPVAPTPGNTQAQPAGVVPETKV